MRRTVSLSRRTEQKLAGWLKANTWIYDKSRDKFRETKHKYLEFEKAAKEVNLSSGELIQWFKGVRTRIGRKKFSMPEQLTERETFLKKNFGFLEAYIVRQNRSSKKDAAETTPAAPPPAPAAPVPSDYDDTSVHSAGVGPAGPSHYTSVHSAGVSPAGASHHKGKDEGPSRQSPEPPPPRSPTPPPPETPREGKGSLAWIADLLRDGVNTREQLAAVQQSQTQHEKLVAGYVGYLQPLLLEIPKSRWKAFTLENIALINSFTEPLPPPAAQPARPPYTPPPAQWLPPHNPFQPPQSPQNPFQPPQPLQPPHTQ
ncbi:hypothetical protein GWK47_047237 [Chionoecetes opilio]|uniref:Uncharacterized protein n=1 Tax=Chionoecetes opilio TaxID=41210 RepID=A0A8J4Y5M8_CHIOP|nr:hypothetical protein GWK47_047237 [Chionoecetes opilio]